MAIWSWLSKNRRRRRMTRDGLVGSKHHLKQDQTIAHAADTSKLIGVLILGGVWAFCVAALIIPGLNSSDYLLVEGQMAPETIYADFSYNYLNKAETQKKRERTRLDEPLVYNIDNALCEETFAQAKETLDKLSARVDAARDQAPQPEDGDDEISRIIASLSGEVIKPLEMIVGDSRKKHIFMDKLAEVVYRGVLDKAALDEADKDALIRVIDRNGGTRKPMPASAIVDPAGAAELCANEIIKDYAPRNRPMLKEAVREIAARIISDNLIYNRELTEARKRAAYEDPSNEVYDEVKKGTRVIQKDQIVSLEVLERFNAYEKERVRFNAISNFWTNAFHYALVSLALLFVTGLYFNLIHPELFRSNQMMGVTATVIVISIAAIFGANEAFMAVAMDKNLPLTLQSCVVPLALAPILLSVLVGFRVALYSGLFVAFIAALRLDSYPIIMMGMFVSCATAYYVRRATNYKSFFLRSLFSISVSVMLAQVFMLWKTGLTIKLAVWVGTLGLGNGVVTGIIALALLFFLESLFQASTDMTLLTLSDYNHPLLKRMQLEAPGTYHHCLIVATLAEQAAGAIGANPIRARACALFHDIGKLSKPEYFTENNLSGENFHAELTPRMSSMIILNHVKEGVDLAINYQLRKIVRDAIEQHHGTDLVYFFYHRALEEAKATGAEVNEADYRYQGPKPRAKEVLLVSLADACEAASRSLDKVSPPKIDVLVWDIFRKRIKDGQLDEADMTFQELALVRSSFVKTLSSMLHGRIKYPKEEEKNQDEGDLYQERKSHAPDSVFRLPGHAAPGG